MSYTALTDPVSVKPAAEHLRRLAERGAEAKRIARHVGVPPTTMHRIRQARVELIEAALEQKILAVDIDEVLPSPTPRTRKPVDSVSDDFVWVDQTLWPDWDEPYTMMAELLEERRAQREWRTRARCVERAIPVSVFFPDDNDTTGERRAKTALARAVCTACPVKLDCRKHMRRVKAS